MGLLLVGALGLFTYAYRSDVIFPVDQFGIFLVAAAIALVATLANTFVLAKVEQGRRFLNGVNAVFFVIFLFVILPSLVIVNVKFDPSKSIALERKVLEVHTGRGAPRGCQVQVHDWKGTEEPRWMAYTCRKIDKMVPKQSQIAFRLRQGFLGFEWIEDLKIVKSEVGS